MVRAVADAGEEDVVNLLRAVADAGEQCVVDVRKNLMACGNSCTVKSTVLSSRLAAIEISSKR